MTSQGIKIVCLLFTAFTTFGCRRNQPDPSATLLESSEVPQGLDYLNQYVGQKPGAVDLWATEPLQSALKKLLGIRYDDFIEDVAEAQELRRDHVLYTIDTASATPDVAAQTYIVALFDTITDRAEVLYLANNKMEQYMPEGKELYLPDEVRNLMFKHLGWQIYEGSLPCDGCAGVKTRLAIEPAGNRAEPGYLLQETYHGIKGSGDTTFQQKGTYRILPGTPDQPGAKVFQIQEASSGKSIYLLQLDEDSLEVLSASQQRREDNRNFRLRKLK